MQYVLSQEEMDSFVPLKSLEDLKIKHKKAGKHIRDEVVGEACIHHPETVAGYCDGCPLGIGDASSLCDLSKEFSK